MSISNALDLNTMFGENDFQMSTKSEYRSTDLSSSETDGDPKVVKQCSESGTLENNPPSKWTTLSSQSDPKFISLDSYKQIGTVPDISPKRSQFVNTLHPLQEWEGYVVEIRESEFVAHLVDLTAGNSSFALEEATIPMQEIHELDAKKMDVGSVFRWVIGFERSVSGTKKRVSHIVFRNLPILTNMDFTQGHEWAEETSQFLKE